MIITDYTPGEHLGCIAPRGQTFAAAWQPGQNKSAAKDRLKRHARQTLPSSYRPQLQKQRHSESNEVNGQTVYLRGQTEHIESRVGQLAAFQKYRTRRDSPDGNHEMMHSWGDFVRFYRDRHGVDVKDAAITRLAQICISSEAFIEVPRAQDTYSLLLWGTPEQVEKAKQELHAWEMHTKGPGVRSKDHPWIKTAALDGRSEYRQIQDQNRQSDFLALQESVLVTDLPHQAQLVWPDGYDLEGFITDYDIDVVPNLRYELNCHIVHEKKARITLIGAYRKEDMYAAYNRLINLTKEMTIRKKKGVHLTMCYLPSTKLYKERVKLNAIAVIGDTVHLPQLTGAALPQQEAVHWPELRSQRSRDHCRVIRKHLESSIKSLQFAQKHVRMRITFGDIGLRKYKKSSTGSGEYAIDEFVPMIQSSEIKVCQCPLRSEITAANVMLDRISKSDDLSSPSYSWAAHFDFHGTQGATNNILRLETEFQPSVVSHDEVERHTVRWLEFRSNQIYDTEKLLELNAVDFEVIGFQLQINAVNLFKNNKVLNDLRNFEENVHFRPPVPGLQYAPNKRSTFPVGQKELRSVREITIARHRFRQTEGIFEIRRIDHFPQGPGQASAVPTWTEWTAAYYYQGWDNLMADFAYNKDGEDVKWERDLATFFPRKIDPNDPRNLPKGFKAFIKEVQEIQKLLADATGKQQLDLMDIDG